MFCTHTLLVFVLLPLGLLSAAHALDFCPSAENDCQSQVRTVQHTRVKSSSNVSVSDLIQDISQFKVSCKNLIGKMDPEESIWKKEKYI